MDQTSLEFLYPLPSYLVVSTHYPIDRIGEIEDDRHPEDFSDSQPKTSYNHELVTNNRRLSNGDGKFKREENHGEPENDILSKITS